MIKAKVDNGIIDIIDINDIWKTTQNDIGRVGVIRDGVIYKLRNRTDTKTGMYKNDLYTVLMSNKNDEDQYKVNQDNIINFDDAKTIRDVINKQDKLKDMESATLISANGNVFIPLNKDDDTKEMLALKEAVRNKHIDINMYESRFGNNFNNDIRIFNKPSITLEKIKTICNALDIEVSIIFKDKEGNIPNPIGKEITTVVTSQEDDDAESDECDE